MSYNFFIIMHADRLHKRVSNEFSGTESFRKKETIALILEQRIFNKAKEMIMLGKPVYFLGSQPDYLSELNGIKYIPDQNDEGAQFEQAAMRVKTDGGTYGLVGGVYSFACIRTIIDGSLKRAGIQADMDPDLTELFYDDFEVKTEAELIAILKREVINIIDPTISKK